METVSDGDITLDLFGVFPGDTEIYEDGVRLCAADGATVGSVGAPRAGEGRHARVQPPITLIPHRTKTV